MATLAIVTSDLHVHKYKQFNQDNRRLGNTIKYIDHLFKFADKNRIQYILFSGDLYNNMQTISTEVENTLIRCFKENFRNYPEIQWLMISGNHDYATKNLLDSPAVSALEHLAEVFDNIWLLDHNGPVSLVDADNNTIRIYGIPYYEYPEHFKSVLTKTAGELGSPAKNILLMHQLVGMDHNLMLDDIDPDDDFLQNFDMIFNGHVHEFKEVRENFINVGSPLHRDAGDIGIDKGFVVIDLEDMSWNFIDMTEKFPQYIHKTVGEELDPWEEDQYVIWVPPTQGKTADEAGIVEQFNTGLAPEELIHNYIVDQFAADDSILEELGVEQEELVNLGMKHLKQ